VARRVDAQLARGLLDEVRDILASGVPPDAHPFTGLVYRQALELLRGERDLAATRDLIIQENRRYAKRQLIWFRKEPNLEWLEGPGEGSATLRAAEAALGSHGMLTDGPNT
jgi:tRNA dimethylallyltransferase